MIGKSDTARGIVYGFAFAAVFGLFYLFSCFGLGFWVANNTQNHGDDTGIGIIFCSIPIAVILTLLVLLALKWKSVAHNLRALQRLAQKKSAP